MTEAEMILAVMEEEQRPLQAKDISRIIYKKFDSYKIYRKKVRNILWDKSGLSRLVIYDQDDYTYVLRNNILELKNKVVYKQSGLSFGVTNYELAGNNQQLYEYHVSGNHIDVKLHKSKITREDLIIGLVKSELEYGDNPLASKIIRRIKLNILNGSIDQ